MLSVLPILSDYLYLPERHHGVLTFRLTQVLTGHGYFGRFLHRIRRDETSGCHYCVDRPEDTVEHTEGVPRLAEDRRVLREAMARLDQCRVRRPLAPALRTGSSIRKPIVRGGCGGMGTRHLVASNFRLPTPPPPEFEWVSERTPEQMSEGPPLVFPRRSPNTVGAGLRTASSG